MPHGPHSPERPGGARNLATSRGQELIVQALTILLTITGVGATVNSCLETKFVALENEFESGIREIRGYLVDHLGRRVPDEVAEAETRDRIAIAILDGAGPDEWMVGGREYKRGDRASVDTWQLIRPVYPDGGRTDPNSECSIEEGGEMTVHGFLRGRDEALVEYRVDGLTIGEPCETGTFFFSQLVD